jgi:threonine synthase
VRPHLHQGGVGFDEITPLKPLEPGLALQALSNGPTLAFKDMAMQLLGNLFEYELARRGEQLNILGATSGDTGSAAEYAMRGKQGVRVFMLSPHGRMSPFQQAQMFSLQDANIHNIAVEGVFDDCQDIVKAVSNDLDFKRKYKHRHRQLDQLGAPAGPGGVLLCRLLPRHKSNAEKVSFAVPVGQLRQRLRRPCGPHDGPADRAAGGGHQRERRARRVLPHRQLPRAWQRRDARNLVSPRWTSARPATSSASCSTCWAATARA